MITEKQVPETDRIEKRSDDDSVYREFASKMAAQIVLNNRSDSVDELIETLKESKYYKTI